MKLPLLRKIRVHNLCKHPLADNELLGRGFYWKLVRNKKSKHYLWAEPIEQLGGFYKICVVPKFWMPNWVVGWIFRCFFVWWRIDCSSVSNVALAGGSTKEQETIKN